MSNFICPTCGLTNIDCGKTGYKTPRELELEENLKKVNELDSKELLNFGKIIRQQEKEIKKLKKDLPKCYRCKSFSRIQGNIDKTYKKLQSDNDVLIQQTFEQHEDILELYRFIRSAEKELCRAGFSQQLNKLIEKHQHLEEVPF